MALRRWKPFLGAFPLIDAAVEGADTSGFLSRDEFRSARGRIVQLLCDAAADDDEKAEGLCALLDEAMAGALATLQAVPAERVSLASGDLVGAVGALMRDHASERVRRLARDVVRGWKADVGAKLTRARAAMDLLDALSTAPPPPPQDVAEPAANSNTKKISEEQPRAGKTSIISNSRRRVSTMESYATLSMKRSDSIVRSSIVKMRTDPIVSSSNVKPTENIGAPAAVLAPVKKMPPASHISSVTEEEKKMDATKRKLHERYQEAEDAKRRRKIQMIKPPQRPPGTAVQRPRNGHLTRV